MPELMARTLALKQINHELCSVSVRKTFRISTQVKQSAQFRLISQASSANQRLARSEETSDCKDPRFERFSYD